MVQPCHQSWRNCRGFILASTCILIPPEECVIGTSPARSNINIFLLGTVKTIVVPLWCEKYKGFVEIIEILSDCAGAVVPIVKSPREYVFTCSSPSSVPPSLWSKGKSHFKVKKKKKGGWVFTKTGFQALHPLIRSSQQTQERFQLKCRLEIAGKWGAFFSSVQWNFWHPAPIWHTTVRFSLALVWPSNVLSGLGDAFF